MPPVAIVIPPPSPVVTPAPPVITPPGTPPARTVVPAPSPQPRSKQNADSYYKQGRVLADQEKFDDAIKSYSQALKLEPNNAPAFNARGYAYLRLRYYESAVADFSEAIRLNPAYANAYWNRSAAKKAAGDKVGAREDLRRAAQLDGVGQTGAKSAQK